MTPYQHLFSAYVTEMRSSKRAAETWWKALLKAEKALRGSKAAAEEALTARWPFGAASHPYVLATYRRNFLLCEAINKRSESGDPALRDVEGPIDAHELLIEMLPGHADDLVEFLDNMVFAPIGLDAADDFI